MDRIEFFDLNSFQTGEIRMQVPYYFHFMVAHRGCHNTKAIFYIFIYFYSTFVIRAYFVFFLLPKLEAIQVSMQISEDNWVCPCPFVPDISSKPWGRLLIFQMLR